MSFGKKKMDKKGFLIAVLRVPSIIVDDKGKILYFLKKASSYA
jgi:hypothetical protein